MLRRIAGAAVVVAVGGCGGSSKPAATPTAQPLSAQSTTPAIVDRVTPADYRAPMERYRRHVGRELGRMLRDVDDLRAATRAGDLGAGRDAWLRADARYERIGAAYGAFGDLDAAINGRPGGLAGGVRSPDFTGLHRIELALWGRRSTRDAAPFAQRLSGDVLRLRARVRRGWDLDPLDYSLRVHEILEDTLHIALAGRSAPWSGSALVALDSNVAGTRLVLDTLRPLLARRDPAGAVRESDHALGRLQRALARLRGRDGSMPRLDALAQREREEIDGLTAGAAEQLAYLPELIDPRPARPKQTPLEAAASARSGSSGAEASP
jgi:iron uptake system EfeUOB component EfeO/EfeM